jgi:hypothetical protein
VLRRQRTARPITPATSRYLDVDGNADRQRCGIIRSTHAFINRGGGFMTDLSGSDAIRLFVLGTLLSILPATSWGQQRPPIADQVAKVYGIDSFSKIDGIRYTFGAELPGVKLSRSWEWNPKTDTVSYAGKDKQGKPVKVTYRRSQLGSQSDAVKKAIDPAFINDQYWLLLPLHVVWDGSATVTDAGPHKLPLGNASAERLVVKYPSQGGYAPGDTWELYIGADKRVEAIVYRRGGTAKPAVVIATWADHRKAGPLLVATDHRGTADGKPVRVSLSDVSVRLTGSDNWISAR